MHPPHPMTSPVSFLQRETKVLSDHSSCPCHHFPVPSVSRQTPACPNQSLKHLFVRRIPREGMTGAHMSTNVCWTPAMCQARAGVLHPKSSSGDPPCIQSCAWVYVYFLQKERGYIFHQMLEPLLCENYRILVIHIACLLPSFYT